MAYDFKGAARESVKGFKKVKWVDALGKSLVFCVQPKRWLPFFAADMAVLFFVFLLVGTMTSGISLPCTLDFASTYGVVMTFVSVTLGIIVLGAVWALLNLWIGGAVIHQSLMFSEFRESWKVSYEKYPTLFAVLVIAASSFLVLSVIPSTLLVVLIVCLVFLFTGQFVVAGGLNAKNAVLGSVRMLRKRTLNVLFSFFIICLFSVMLMIVFSLPLMRLHLSYTPIGDAAYRAAYILSYSDRAALYSVMSLFFVGFSISRTFALKFLTEVYLGTTKKRFLFF